MIRHRDLNRCACIPAAHFIFRIKYFVWKLYPKHTLRVRCTMSWWNAPPHPPTPHPPPQKKITMGYHYFLLEEKPWVCATMIWPHRLSQSLETFALSSSSQIFVAKITANCAPNIFAPYLLPLSAIRFSPTSRCNASASATQTFLNTRPPCWTVVGRDGHSIRSVRGKTAWILVPEQQRQFAKTAAFRRIQ